MKIDLEFGHVEMSGKELITDMVDPILAILTESEAEVAGLRSSLESIMYWGRHGNSPEGLAIMAESALRRGKSSAYPASRGTNADRK